MVDRLNIYNTLKKNKKDTTVNKKNRMIGNTFLISNNKYENHLIEL